MPINAWYVGHNGITEAVLLAGMAVDLQTTGASTATTTMSITCYGLRNDGEPMEKEPVHNKSIIDQKQTTIDGMNRALGLVHDLVHSDYTHQQVRVALKRFFRDLKAGIK